MKTILPTIKDTKQENVPAKDLYLAKDTCKIDLKKKERNY
jgi:hypothetical protein